MNSLRMRKRTNTKINTSLVRLDDEVMDDQVENVEQHTVFVDRYQAKARDVRTKGQHFSDRYGSMANGWLKRCLGVQPVSWP